MKVLLAISVVILCIAIGASALSFLEGLDFMDSLYLSVMSVTTVGYGDHAFKTMKGRVFACLWLLISTLAVAKSFIYLAEARINKRHKRIAKWSLHRNLTVEDLLAADLNHNGFIRSVCLSVCAYQCFYFFFVLMQFFFFYDIIVYAVNQSMQFSS